MEKIKGITKTGFEFEFSMEHVNNYEYLELLAQAEEEPLKLPKVIEFTLGKKQKERLVNHLKSRNENGICTLTDMQNALTEIFQIASENISELKN